jgi:hypothetical protein
MNRHLVAALLMLFGVASALAQVPPYVYAITLGTSSTQVLPVDPLRKRLIFVNPGPTALVAVCELTMTRFSRVSKNPVVPQKVREAFRLMQDDPAMTLQLAAAAVKLNTYKLREFLGKPHGRKWIIDEKRLQLDAICAANPEALRQIRDSSENDMARVNSVKTLEGMKELIDPSAVRAGTQVHSPGLVVQIINGASGEVERTIGAQPPTPMIDVTPIEQSAD